MKLTSECNLHVPINCFPSIALCWKNIVFPLRFSISEDTWWNLTCHVGQAHSDLYLPFSHFEIFYLVTAVGQPLMSSPGLCCQDLYFLFCFTVQCIVVGRVIGSSSFRSLGPPIWALESKNCSLGKSQADDIFYSNTCCFRCMCGLAIVKTPQFAPAFLK